MAVPFIVALFKSFNVAIRLTVPISTGHMQCSHMLWNAGPLIQLP